MFAISPWYQASLADLQEQESGPQQGAHWTPGARASTAAQSLELLFSLGPSEHPDVTLL